MTTGTRHGITVPSGSGLVGMEGSVTAHGGHGYGTDCQRQRKGLRDPSDVSEETESQRRGLPYPDSIPLSHTHVQLLLVPFLQDSPRAGARTPGPLGPLVGCRILGAWRSPAPQCPGCTYGSIFPSPGLWTASPVPGLCSRPLILGWVSHMPRSPPAASLAPTHSQQRDGPYPLAWGGEGCSSPARWAPSGATVLGALKAA